MRLAVLAVVVLSSVALVAQAEPAVPLEALSKMPVKEITVFKDGHAFVLHEGKMNTDAAGEVVLDYLPSPVMGTFWPYSADKNIKLTSVVASQRKVQIERTAMTLRELIEANIGTEMRITENGITYNTTIVSMPCQSGEELEATSPPGTGEKLPVKSNLVLLKTSEGEKVVPIERITEITFKGEHKTKLANEEMRNLLKLQFDWAGKEPAKAVDVGMVYLQKGIRWIPSYRVSLDGKGNATVKLEATLINEMVDIKDATCNLVVGVPSFDFKDTADPIGMQQAVAQLSQYFRQDASSAGAFSNAIMTQARLGERMQAAPSSTAQPTVAPMDLGPEMAGTEQAEDLFIYTVKHVTLKKGQRMVLPIVEFTLPYKDVYVLDISITPPSDVFKTFDNNRQAEIARLLAAPKAMHKIRLTNKSEYPLTTAPVIILKNDRILAQGMMTYTSIGGKTDLGITTAVDINVRKIDKETKRTPNAERWDGYEYARIDLAGKITLTNYRKEAVEIEVVRNVLGNIDEADHEGTIDKVNVLEDATFGASGYPYGYSYPSWWRWYGWPYWWSHFNGVGRITWNVKLEAGKTADLGYTWNYYWR
ncbi:MAG: hypothetical protein EHM48_02235 [Planctomycetaceae bacterium]|nr:MAG: hypothetical protein EHM48_02235 [Planctomycetaceae bacterium]